MSSSVFFLAFWAASRYAFAFAELPALRAASAWASKDLASLPLFKSDWALVRSWDEDGFFSLVESLFTPAARVTELNECTTSPDCAPGPPSSATASSPSPAVNRTKSKYGAKVRWSQRHSKHIVIRGRRTRVCAMHNDTNSAQKQKPVCAAHLSGRSMSMS